jgi:hypothetical protein
MFLGLEDSARKPFGMWLAALRGGIGGGKTLFIRVY